MKNRFYIIILCTAAFLLSKNMIAQENFNNNSYNKKGSVNIFAPHSLDNLIEKKKIYDTFNSKYNGYRVQIYFEAGANSKNGAFEAADKLYEIDTTMAAYISYNSPYYRVRVGNFRNKLDAEKAKNFLQTYFHGCFIVNEEIKTSDKRYIPLNSFSEN
ncbi:MAG: SPOR domain-containing protein [Bacteroidales bacterium]|jgi:hypothetical protein